MTFTVRSIFRFLLVMLLSLGLLTGCQPTSPVSDGVIHLTLWHGVNPPPNRDVLQRLVDQFNQTHPTIQVESLYVGQSDQQMPKLLASVVGNVPPHMLWNAPTLTGQLVELDALRVLDDWLAESPLRAEIDPALLETMIWEGHVWSIPFDVNNVGIFYRPSLFAAAGITELPQTWGAFRQVARQLTRPEVNQHGIQLPLGKGEWAVFTWLPFMWSGGGELLTPTDEVTVLNSGAIAALQLWRDLLDDGSAILSPPERGYELDKFLEGQVAMQITGPWTLGQLQATGKDFAVMPIPTGIRPATSIGGENLFIFKTTPEEERAAWTFAEYVLSEAFQTEWAIGTGYLPVNLKSRENPAYLDFIAQQPALNVFLQQAPYGRSRPIIPGYNRISENLGRSIEATLLNKSTPEDALTTAQSRVDLAIGRERRMRE
ncbi:ABC transporter substrate-binding protein [Thermocoleostomius sinensis]|uniref:ABC transporter substrate-binding protein n=1 Tax=Thermocoleostomius sinensis A174 TaxID=2016057 RepID=A0A9E9CBM9_9CYAN|nr:ABC transporter substrate-binding protein [Thermocoleostomius sinensis]WAL60830.1 ABC transporter substrate-binding protein [Thermocoleostomius sinensis A174]